MPDNQLDILIKFGLNKDQATAAVSEINKVKTATTEAGKEAVKQETAVEEATTKTFTSKKQLKDMIKGLTGTFPMLAHAAHLALNPLTLLTASIATGFALWTRRVNELTQALGGIEMGDVSTTATERIDAMAQSWGKVAANMAAAATASKAIRSDYELTLKLIESNDKFAKALGFDTGSRASDQKAAATASAADAMESDARRRLGRAGTPGSPEAEARLAAKYAAEVAKAEKEKAAAEARKNDILTVEQESRTGLTFGGLGAAARYSMRYGRIMPDQALALENQNISSQQQIVDAGANYAAGTAGRAVRRNEITAANQQLDEVNRLRQEVQSLRQESATQRATAGLAQVSAGAGGFGGLNLVGFGQAASDLAAGATAVARAIDDMNKANAVLRSRLKAQGEQQ